MRRGPSFLLLLLLAGSAIFGKKKPVPGDDQVVAAIRAAVAAATTDFSGAMGPVDAAWVKAGWVDSSPTTIWLPGSDLCSLHHDPRKLNPVDGQVIGIQHQHFWYSCDIVLARSPNRLLDRYNALIKIAGQATGWPYTALEGVVPGGHRVLFQGPDKLNSISVMVSVAPGRRPGWILQLAVIPAQTTSFPQSPFAGAPAAIYNSQDSERIRKEVESIEASGRYLRLPMPQAVNANVSSASGVVVRKVENGTAYTLTVLLAGPVSQEIVLAPGATQILNLPIGTYKVAERVPAPNVPPFFGLETYDAGHDYESHFYIQ